MNRGDEEGFTLIEVFFSFVILSGAIIMAFQVSATSLGALRDAEKKSKVTEIVANEVDERIALGTITSANNQGQTDGVVWSITAVPLEGPSQPGALRPWLVKGYSEGPTPVLETVILGR